MTHEELLLFAAGICLSLQDASEFFQYLLDIMTRAERGAGARLAQAVQQPTASAFEFGIETRVQCSESGRVSYKRDAPTNVLALNIPMEAAANKSEVEEYQVRRPCRALGCLSC